MRLIKISFIALLLVSVAATTVTFAKGGRSNKMDTATKGFAVVELFTSEGCSSCPPADALVAKIQKEDKDKSVYILAYHVDYWNRLGWKDVFSSADFSKRQHDYANYLHLQSVYTPQVIVNGKKEFIGSEEVTLRSAINAGLQKSATAHLTLTGVKTDQNQASLKYTAEGTDKNTVLLVAVLQKSALSKVERGENGGRTLSHVQIVRKLQPIILNSNDGLTTVALPRGFNTHDWEIIGFLQNKSNGAVVGAARAALL